MDKIKLAILGSCITRDAIETNIARYDVERYVTFISPYTIQDGKTFDIPQENFSKSGISNFVYRCLSLDAEKKALSYIKAAECEWLILDMTTLQSPIFEWDDGQIISQPHQSNKCIPSIMSFFNKPPKVYECWELPQDLLHDRVYRMCRELLKIFKPDKIIFNESYGAYEYISKGGMLIPFNSSIREKFGKINDIYSVCYQIAKECLNGCHIILPINNIVGSETHKWGLHPLHYCDKYYEYAEKAISIITQKYAREMEDEKLEFLQQLYCEKFATLREKAMSNNIRADRDKWQAYSTSFKSLILNNQLTIDGNLILQFQNELLKKDYRHISIYGDTEITKVLCKVLGGGNTVSIDYIVENADKPVPGFKTINRNPAEYPNCDIMLVADIYSYNDIKVKLERLKVPFPFVNAAEFIKSLPAESGDGIEKVKEKIQSLEEQMLASKAEEEKLSSRVDELIKENESVNKNATKLTAERDKLAAEKSIVVAERNSANAEIDSLKNSISFKLGRFFTFIPRKIRGVFKERNDSA